VVRYAVAVGLEALAQVFLTEASPPAEAALQELTQALRQLQSDPQEEAPVVQLRAALALQRLGLEVQSHG